MNDKFMTCYDDLDECVLSLETEAFKLRLLSNFLSNVDGLPDGFDGFLGSFFQTAEYIQQSAFDIRVLVNSVHEIVVGGARAQA